LSRTDTDYVFLGLTEQVDIIGEIAETSVIAKVDTGADRTSIDSEIASIVGATRTGESYVTRYPTGGSRERELIRVNVRIRGEVYDIEAVLDQRSNMNFRVVIGKDVLTSGRFVIVPFKEIMP
jgi:hypothetical protein